MIFRSMHLYMSGVVNERFQIIYSIIRINTIFMINNGIWK